MALTEEFRFPIPATAKLYAEKAGFYVDPSEEASRPDMPNKRFALRHYPDGTCAWFGKGVRR